MSTIPLPLVTAKPSNPAHSLATIQIASPCHVPFASMPGDDKRRFCGECKKNVYNLSAMTAQEAEALIQSTGGKLCATFYRRADGTVLTQDCPVGVQAKLRAAWARSLARVAAVAVLGLSFFGFGCKARGFTGASAIGLEAPQVPIPTPIQPMPGGIAYFPPPPPPPPPAGTTGEVLYAPDGQ
ncbi:MAG TPA: hypothetical protein VL860_03885 [Planctomycetota bacterium]|nr:hypothetical protein [Planctomycetota bacterium]